MYGCSRWGRRCEAVARLVMVALAGVWLLGIVGCATSMPPTCQEDADCQFCLGQTCQNSVCVDGTAPCPDDGIFCNGTEFCIEDEDRCASTGDPCFLQVKTCDEATASCLDCEMDEDCFDGQVCEAHTCVDPPPTGKLYWALQGRGEIWRADLDGVNAELLHEGLELPCGLRVDPGGAIYIASCGSGAAEQTIFIASTDGTGSVSVFWEDPLNVLGLALDLGSGEIYFSTQNDFLGGGGVFRLNGLETTELIFEGASFPKGPMDVDQTNRLLYARTPVEPNTLLFSTLDGGPVQGCGPIPLGGEIYFRIGPDGYVYFADLTNGTLNVMKNCETPETLAASAGAPTSVAATSTHVYWADRTQGDARIRRVDLNGDNDITIVPGLEPDFISIDIALDP